MQVTLNPKELVKALRSIKKLYAGPVIGDQARLYCGDTVVVRGTDLQTDVYITLPKAVTTEEGSVTLPIAATISALKDIKCDVLMEVSGETIEIIASNGRIILPNTDKNGRILLDEESYPAPAPPIGGVDKEVFSQYLLNTSELVDAIGRTAFCTDFHDNRYALGGILFVPENNKMKIVATDGRRMGLADPDMESVQSMPVPKDEHGKDERFLPPRTACTVFAEVCGKTDGKTVVSLMQRYYNDKSYHSMIVFANQTVTIFSRCLEGRFPMWRDILLGITPTTKVRGVAVSLLNAFKQAEAMCGKGERKVQCRFTQNYLSIEAEAGQFRVPVTLEGADMDLRVFAPFFVEALKSLPRNADVTIELTAPGRPIIMRDNRSMWLIMPLSQK